MFRYLILSLLLFILSSGLTNCDDKPKWVFYEWFIDGSEYINFSKYSYHIIASDNHGNVWITREEYEHNDHLTLTG
jgi:hypothetical protein